MDKTKGGKNGGDKNEGKKKRREEKTVALARKIKAFSFASINLGKERVRAVTRHDKALQSISTIPALGR